MKAAVLTEWEKIQIKDISVPEIGEEECLIKVKYAGICGSDVHIYGGHHPTAKPPVVLGHEFVGIVEKINSRKRDDIKIGDRVVVEPLISCGICPACIEGNRHVCRNLKLLGIHVNGGFAEYAKVSAEKVIKIGDNLTDRAAALSEPFAVGFHVNQRGGLKNGDKALIIGGGPIGLVVGMTAKVGGASIVAFSEVNEARIEQIKSFGFETINPLKENADQKANNLTGGSGFDVVFEVSGSQSGMQFAIQACKIRGTVVSVGFPSKKPEFDILQIIFKELTVVGSRVYTLEHFKRTVKMLERIVEEKLFDVENLISDTYSLEELERAINVMIRGENLGKILIEY